MIAPTHLAFGTFNGIVLLSLTTTIGDQPIRADIATVLNIAALLIGSLAPDLDSPGSAISRALPFSRLIHRRWAHRTLWHSILGLSMASAFVYLALSAFSAVLPISLPYGTATGFFSAAYASHLVADCLTVRGVPFLYPYPIRFAYPSIEHYRLRTGNRRHELTFTGISLVASLLYIPVIQAGGAKASLHLALGDLGAAFDDYKQLSGQEALLAFSGSYTDTREPVEGSGVILEAAPQRFLVFFHEQVVVVGGTKGDILATDGRCIPTDRPVAINTITITSKPWADIVRQVPAGALATGELSANHAFTTGDADHTTPTSISPTSQKLKLTYAQLHELAQLQPSPRTKEERLTAERAALTQSLADLRRSIADTLAARTAQNAPYERERLFGALNALRTKQTSLTRRLERVGQDLTAARTVQLRFSGMISLRTPNVN